MRKPAKKLKVSSSSTPSTSTSTPIDGIDRISNLPDDVLHNILSYLYIFDIVQLSLLSRRFKYIWNTMPYLHFDLNRFYTERINRNCSLKMVGNFRNFINWIFISQSSSKLARFLLCCESIFHKDDILRWIHAVTRRDVRELVLQLRPDEAFLIPYCVATCQSLQVLKLHLSGDELRLPNHLGFRNLKLLRLEQVELSDEHLMSRLITNCHLLERLVLEDCGFGDMTLLHIASTSLVYLTFRNYCGDQKIYANCGVKISCPKLKFLKYKAPIPKYIIVEELLSVEGVHILFFGSGSAEKPGVLVHKIIKEASSTSVLKLCMFAIWNLHKVVCEDGLSPITFNNLKFLRLKVGIDESLMQAMILLLKYSPNLEVLKLWSDENQGWSENWHMHDPDESIMCLESRLKSIQLTDFKNEENEMELLRFFLKNARALEKLKVAWACYAVKSEETLQEVLKFPRASSLAVVTFLDARPLPKPLPRNWYDRS